MIYALSLGAITLVVTVLAGYPAVNLLRRLKIGKEISEWGPESHQSKAGTPTMGGLLIFVSMTLPFVVVGRHSLIGLTVWSVMILCALRR